MNLKLADKVVIVAGACGRLGSEFVRAIIQHGAKAIIADIDVDAGLALKQQLQAKTESQNVDFVQLDITSKLSLQNSIRQVQHMYGQIDGLVNSAYPRTRNYGRSLFEVEYEDFCQNINQHLGGYFLASQQYAAFFQQQGWGTIINIASVYGLISPRFDVYEKTTMTMPVEYAAAKAAVIHLTKYFSKYLSRSNIRVNAISPGGVLDNQPESFVKAYQALSLGKGLLNREDIAGTVIFLLSDDSKYINGQNIVVDDGFSL